MGAFSVIWRRLLGAVSLSFGLILGVGMLYHIALGHYNHEQGIFGALRALFMPGLLIAVGVHWMRGKTVHMR